MSGADNTPNVLNIPPESSDEPVNSVVSLLAPATHTKEFSFYPPVPDDWLGTECADGLEAFCLFLPPEYPLRPKVTSLRELRAVSLTDTTSYFLYCSTPCTLTDQGSPTLADADGDTTNGTLLLVTVVTPHPISAVQLQA